MRLRRYILALAFLIASTPSLAADPAKPESWWIVIQKDINGNAQLGESSSIEWRSDGRTYFWVHMFYAYPQDGLKSALIQYSVHCSEKNIREHQYIDFDANREEISRGDNTSSDDATPVRPGTTTELLVGFACSSEINRKKNFTAVSNEAGIWEVGEFFSDPRPIVKQ